MITDFREKKLASYLVPDQKVLIRFGHGLGDTMMFYPCLEALRCLYPQTVIDLYVENGQEEIWTSIGDKDAPGYDLVFSLDFAMSEGENGLTKAEKCCRDELGIPAVDRPWTRLPCYDTPLVCCHFQGTALPGSVNWPWDQARQVWQEVAAFGKLPFECHFQHGFHNPANEQYPFVDNSARRYRASLPNLIGLLQRSWAFIGVASGPWCVAMSVLPGRTLLLEKDHKLESYTHEPAARLTLDDFQEGQITSWLTSLRDDPKEEAR
jgi:hypothetical protein